jgi:hypothetical protein
MNKTTDLEKVSLPPQRGEEGTVAVSIFLIWFMV